MVFLSNERIPFVVMYDKIKSNRMNVLLGDVVEHPDYITPDKEIDYLYYLR
jgi:hypothetical protein